MNRTTPVPKMEKGGLANRPNATDTKEATTYTRIEQCLIALGAALIAAAIIGGLQ